jgi:hypothetical protein
MLMVVQGWEQDYWGLSIMLRVDLSDMLSIAASHQLQFIAIFQHAEL